MDIWEFYLNRIKSKDSNKILDYGCGSGDFVKYARNKGWDIQGVENFYGNNQIEGGSVIKNEIEIYLIKDGVIPFKDESFDAVTSMQVFEHVEDLDLVLREIYRVLKSNGFVLCDFPLKYSINEPHYNIPFSHWFPKKSKLRKLFCKILFDLGFGSNRKSGETFNDWYAKAFGFIDNFCHYRSETQFRRICSKYGFLATSLDYQRLKDKLQSSGSKYRVLLFCLNLSPAKFIAKILRIKASSTFELRKESI